MDSIFFLLSYAFLLIFFFTTGKLVFYIVFFSRFYYTLFFHFYIKISSGNTLSYVVRVHIQTENDIHASTRLPIFRGSSLNSTNDSTRFIRSFRNIPFIYIRTDRQDVKNYLEKNYINVKM